MCTYDEFQNDSIINLNIVAWDRHCDVVVRVPGYRSRDPGIDSRRYHIF
jgi:hypothetical protein